MWYGIAFIGGAVLGMIVMSLAAMSGYAELEEENARLRKALKEKD